MAKVEYKNDVIVIDNSELLWERADVSTLKEEDMGGEKEGRHKVDVEGLGSIEHGAEEEKQLKQDLKRTGWHEAKGKSLKILHVCPVCGVKFPGRRGKVYCSMKCKETGKKRNQRAKKREERDFKPHLGAAGEVYFMEHYEGKDVITFVPAFYATSRKEAEKYIDEHYMGKYVEEYKEQIREVIK